MNSPLVFNGQIRDHEYFIRVVQENLEVINIEIFDEGIVERWGNVFDSFYINEITSKAGCSLDIDSFLEIIKESFSKNCVDVLTMLDIENIKGNKLTENNNDSHRYLILKKGIGTKIFSFPLSLPRMPFSESDLKGIIVSQRNHSKKSFEKFKEKKTSMYEKQIDDLQKHLIEVTRDRDYLAKIVDRYEEEIYRLESICSKIAANNHTNLVRKGNIQRDGLPRNIFEPQTDRGLRKLGQYLSKNSVG